MRVKTTQATPKRNRTTDVARQHDKGSPQGDKISGGFNLASGAHTLCRAVSCKICSTKTVNVFPENVEPGMGQSGVTETEGTSRFGFGARVHPCEFTESAVGL